MFLYPALLAGFLFVAVPLLVHLINMLRHRRQRWAAMDFLLASYRKQKKWIHLRQLLLLLARLAVAALLIAMLCGWTGSRQLLGVLGGETTHHVVILDDSYSMGDVSGGSTAYRRSLLALQDLTRRLATDDGNHQLTVMRASRALMTTRGGSESGDAAADLSVQTITSDARLINRVMSTTASPVRTDLVPALDLATKLITSTPADSKFLYIASDFRRRDWGSPERLAESLRSLPADDVQVRMIDCAVDPQPNLGITALAPLDDVWVAGVPVVVSVTVHNYSTQPATNVSIANRVIRYDAELQSADPTLTFSGKVDSLPPLLIDTLAPGDDITKTFQVYVTAIGTHAIEATLPDDALPIDNIRACSLPLTDVGQVLVIDNDPDAMGAYHVASVLDPGSQVRIGAVPDVKPPSFLNSVTIESLTPYRAIYLIDLPEIGENASAALATYVRRGGGLAWFLGSEVRAESYNKSLLGQDRQLLPARLTRISQLPAGDGRAGDIGFGQADTLLDPLRGGGDGVFALVGLSQSWLLETTEPSADSENESESQQGTQRPRVRVALERRDGNPLVTEHQVGQGRIVTVLTGLDDRWTNWRSDYTFVPFLLLTNASLWSGAAPSTARSIDRPLVRRLPTENYLSEVTYVPATSEPPRVPIELTAVESQSDSGGDDLSLESMVQVRLDPTEMVIAGEPNVDEILRPGISEWVFTRSDGRGQVEPVASVIRIGEGDLSKAKAAEITQSLLPLDVKFVSSQVWSEENRAAGSSTLTLFLLALLGLVLAGEQLLAYWASYHVSSSAGRP